MTWTHARLNAIRALIDSATRYLTVADHARLYEAERYLVARLERLP